MPETEYVSDSSSSSEKILIQQPGADDVEDQEAYQNLDLGELGTAKTTEVIQKTARREIQQVEDDLFSDEEQMMLDMMNEDTDSKIKTTT